MAKTNDLLRSDEKLTYEVQQYKCLYDKSTREYKERDHTANAWAAVENTQYKT